MGLFKSIREAANRLKGDDPIAGAIVARGVITGIEPTGTSVILQGIEHYFCRITLEVQLDGTEPYTAITTHRMTPWAIANVRVGVTVVAVGVDPVDRLHVRVDHLVDPSVAQ